MKDYAINGVINRGIKKMSKNKIETTLIRAGSNPSEFHGALNVPVYRASTFAYKTVQGFLDGKYKYGRTKTPTANAFETAIAELDGAEGSLATGSGYSAITLALLSTTKAHDHILIIDSSYLHTKNFSDAVLMKRMNIEVEYFSPLIGEGIRDLIKENTSTIFLEAPTSSSFITCDIGAIVKIAKEKGIKTIIDNTWSTPLILKPLELGIDISLMSATKYITGHSDAMLGVVSANKETFHDVQTTAVELGLCAGCEEVYMGTRGLHTLAVRMNQHEKSALEIAKWLETRKEVKAVLHPALEQCAGHENWKKYIKRSSGTFGIVLHEKDEKKIFKFLDSLDLFYKGVSWGGYESLALYRQPDIRNKETPLIDGSYIRLHIGLENVEDLKADLDKALNTLK